MANAKFSLKSLTVDEFNLLTNEVLRNDKIGCGTTICLQMFHNVIGKFIQSGIIECNYYEEVQVLSLCIKNLRKKNKFNSFLFIDSLIEEYSALPLEIIWWLCKHEIVSLFEYCSKCPSWSLAQPDIFAAHLTKLFKSNCSSKTFPSEEIIQDLLIELVRGCYRPNVSIYRLHVSGIWVKFCTLTIEAIIGQILQVVLGEEREAKAINILGLIQNRRNYLPGVIVRRFFKNILKTLLCQNCEEFDLQSCYVYQQLFCSKRIDLNLHQLYSEVFREHCTIDDILEIIQEAEDKVNWKFTLAAIGVCTEKSPSAPREITEAALNFINSSFKGGKTSELIKAILIIRQGCLEKSMNLDYATWYSTTFGRKNNFKTTYTVSLFKFLISTLIVLIPLEPESYLKIQINSIIAPPAQCNYLIHDYKDLCKQRLQELQKSPNIVTNQVAINVRSIIDELERLNKVTPILKTLRKNKDETSLKIIVNEASHSKSKALDILKDSELLIFK